MDIILLIVLAIVIAYLIKQRNDLNDKIEILERSISTNRENMRESRSKIHKCFQEIRELKPKKENTMRYK